MPEGEEAGHRDHATRIFASHRARTVADCSTDSENAHLVAADLNDTAAEAAGGMEDTVDSEEGAMGIREEPTHRDEWEVVLEAGILTKLMRTRTNCTSTELPSLTAVAVAAVNRRRRYEHLASLDHQILMGLLREGAEAAVGQLSQSVDLWHTDCSPWHSHKAVDQKNCLGLAHWGSLDVGGGQWGARAEEVVGVGAAVEEAIADVLRWAAGESRSHSPHRGVVSALSLISGQRAQWVC